MIKILNLRIGDIVRISKHKNIFANGYVHSSIPILNENKLLELFKKKNYKKQIKKGWKSNKEKRPYTIC